MNTKDITCTENIKIGPVKIGYRSTLFMFDNEDTVDVYTETRVLNICSKRLKTAYLSDIKELHSEKGPNITIVILGIILAGYMLFHGYDLKMVAITLLSSLLFCNKNHHYLIENEKVRVAIDNDYNLLVKRLRSKNSQIKNNLEVD